MASERGDQKPCTHSGCRGTMQFGREPLPQSASGARVTGERGWVCGENAGHFMQASEHAPRTPAASTAHQARWDDDGGTVPPRPGERV